MAPKLRTVVLIGLALLITLSIYFHASMKWFTEQLWLMKSSCDPSAYSSSILSVNRVSREEQQIVFMAGPHKTGSTSIQVNLATWSLGGLLGQWRWGIKDTTCVFVNIPRLRNGRKPENRKTELLFAKGYSPLMNLLANTGVSYPNDEAEQSALIDCYKNQLKDLWKDGYNIVLGSEAADFALRSNVDATKFFRGIVNIMPTVRTKDSSIIERITFVITYRYPRVDHFVSYWHMAGNPPPLREWTLQTKYELHPLNPLGLAQLYLDFGFKVIILDSSGLQKENVDLSNAVACDILRAPCMNGNIIGNTQTPEIRNPGDDNGMKDLNHHELSSINQIIRKHDCNYRHLLFHANVTIKYGHMLVQSMLNCSVDHQFVPWSSAVAQIKEVAQGQN